MGNKRKTMNHAILVLAAVIRNIHLKRVLHEVDSQPRLNFWCLIYGNLLDMAVIEWCKLFGSDHEEHQPVHWKNIFPEAEHNTFRQGLLHDLKITHEEWLSYWEEVKGYRDNHAAHFNVDWLRHENERRYPRLELALQAAYYYYGKLISKLEANDAQHRYPKDIKEYSDRFVTQARKAARKAIAATADMVERVL